MDTPSHTSIDPAEVERFSAMAAEWWNPSGKFKPLLPDADGIIRSQVFPGLWLHVEAFLNRDGQRLVAALRQGLASPQHATTLQGWMSRVRHLQQRTRCGHIVQTTGGAK